MQGKGFTDANYELLMGGVCALYVGTRNER
jgi:hypothetical protein